MDNHHPRIHLLSLLIGVIALFGCGPLDTHQVAGSESNDAERRAGWSDALTTTRPFEAPVGSREQLASLSYSELAALRSVAALDDVIAQSDAIHRSAMPHDAPVKAFRKLLQKLRDQLDLFAHAYARGSAEEKTWRTLRVEVDDGYELIGQFKDLFDSQALSLAVFDPGTHSMSEGVRAEDVEYPRDELKARRRRMLDWHDGFTRPAKLGAARRFLADPGSRPYRVRREDLSEFFWGGVEVEPRQELSGLANIARLNRAQFKKALEALDEVEDFDDLAHPAREQAFHDLRKRMRSANNVLVQFPELVQDEERTAELQETLVGFVSEYGVIEDQLVAFHLESGNDAEKIEKRIDGLWKKLRQRQKDEQLDEVLRDLARSAE